MAVLLALSLVMSCSDPTTQAPRVGFLLGSMQNERYQKDRQAFIGRVEELGGTVRFESAGGDHLQQLEQAKRVLGDVDVLVVQPVDSEQAAALVEAAHEAQVPVIAYDRLILNAPVDYYVTQDSLEVGRQQAIYALKALGNNGKILICQGSPNHSVAQQITQGNLEVLEQQSQVEVIGTPAHSHWGVGEAHDTVRGVLEEHPDVRAILCNNSAMARGALLALQEAEIEGVYIAGADADLQNCRAVLEGRQGMDVLKAIEPLGTRAAELALALAKGEHPTPDRYTPNGSGEIPTAVTRVTPFDRDNLKAVIIDSGFHPKEALR